VPVLFKLGVVALIWTFPIDERRQRVIRLRLAAREARQRTAAAGVAAGAGPQRRQT
jgi:hypothetical protein